MLDAKSRKLVRFLRNCGGSVCFADDPELPDGVYDETDDAAFWTMIEYLEEQGVLVWDDNRVTLRLSHVARHPITFGWFSVLRYLRDNWIAILALIVSIVALVRTLPTDTTRAEPAATPQAISSMSSSEISSSP